MEAFLEKNRTRAQTRFNLDKKRKECSRYFWLIYLDNQDENEMKRKIGKISHNPKVCSCWMCGNPRKKYKGRREAKMTLAERKNLDSINIKNYLQYDDHY